MTETITIDRPPRVQYDFPLWEEALPEPPQRQTGDHFVLTQLARPLLMVLIFGAMSVLGRGDSNRLLYVLPTALLTLVTVAFTWRNIGQHEQAFRRQEALYLEDLNSRRQKLAADHDQQARYYWHEYAGPEKRLAIAGAARAAYAHGGQHTPLSARLWPIRPGDADFAGLRLGVGVQRSTTTYLPPKGDSTNRLTREAQRLAADSRFVAGVPLVVSLRPAEDAPPHHAVGIVGRDEALVHAYVQALLVEFTATHAPTDARLFVVGGLPARSSWEWAAQLPHCRAGRHVTNLHFEDDNPGEEREDGGMAPFLRGLRRILEQRLTRQKDSQQTDATLPFLLVVVDLLGDSARLDDLEADPTIAMLLHDGRTLGAAVLFLVAEREKVPGACGAIIDVEQRRGAGQAGERRRAEFRYTQTGTNTLRYAGEKELLADKDSAMHYASLLTPLTVRQSYGANLPDGITLFEMLRVQDTAALRQLTLRNWRFNMEQGNADWLKAPIGVLPGGEVRWLKFSAEADGFHGMHAGTTGSGKSELLNTEILSLAIQYPPSMLNFLLIDFKGGMAFEPFRRLPHCVDVVTNLTEAEVDRVFDSISAELERRSKLNAQLGAGMDVVAYRREGLHLPPYGRMIAIRGREYRTAPFPHLLVIIDEFAEMIALKPEYKARLESITRLGRALGVTLILAAQRPSGVTDQMRANIKARICLRVETPEESAEVLRRRDAYYLPQVAGRGYLQSGSDSLEMIQIAYSGDRYTATTPGEGQLADVDAHDRPRVYDVVINLLRAVADEEGQAATKPWPDFLPDRLSLETPLPTRLPAGWAQFLSAAGPDRSPAAGGLPEDEPVWATVVLNAALAQWRGGGGRWPGIDWKGQAMRAIVGLVDDPHQAVQTPLELNFRKDHVAVFAASGWGKTTLLQTTMLSLAATHSPAELHIYVMDFGGRMRALFERLPHVGAVVAPDESERVYRLFRRLADALERRKQLISEAGARDLYEYNAADPATPLPALLVVIDNYAELKESFDSLVPALNALLRESRAYGIHFLITADRPAVMGSLFSLITGRLTLKQADKGEYAAVVGRVNNTLEEIEGRGWVRLGKHALQFQAALPVEPEANEDESAAVRRVLTAMSAQWTAQGGARPATIGILPERILWPALAAAAAQEPSAGRLRAPLGLRDVDLQPWAVEFGPSSPHWLIVGPPGSGKSATLRALALALAQTYTPEEVQILIVDFQRHLSADGALDLAALPHVQAIITRYAQLAAVLEPLAAHYADASTAEGRPALLVLIDNYDGFVEEVEAEEKRQDKTFAVLARLAREYGADGLHFVLAGGLSIVRSADKLRKQVMQARYGLCLQAPEAVGDFNGKSPRSVGELPPGRGYVVRAGRVSLVQVATTEDGHSEVA